MEQYTHTLIQLDSSLVIGAGSNKWLFNTYTSTSFLQLTSSAIGGCWSSTLFGLGAYGNISFTGNLTCMFRHIMYVSSATIMYLIVWFIEGTNTYGIVNPGTFIRYKRIA